MWSSGPVEDSVLQATFMDCDELLSQAGLVSLQIAVVDCGGPVNGSCIT